MALVLTYAGQIKLLTYMFKSTSINESFSLHLYNNSVTPSAASVLSDLSETSFNGYSSVTLLRSNWQDAITSNGSGQTQYNTSSVSWSCNGSGDTIYGAFVLDGGGTLMWVEAFSVARTISNGDVLNYQPVFTLT